MLVTKREVKQTSKKLLSVLLAFIMMMTSMSVCFGTFVTASAADDALGALADLLKDESYSNTISLLAKNTDSGSGVSRKMEITFSSYINYKQAAEILRAVDTAMKASEAYNHALKYLDDQQGGCEGRTTQDVYNEFIKELAKKGVNTDDGTNVQKALRRILTWDGAKLHSDAVKSSSQSTWTNKITFSTSDYKGYLAQVGKAANVGSSVELGVAYTITMPGNLYYGVAGSCGSTTKYYHHMFWPKDAAVNAPATNSSNTEMKSKVDEHIAKLNKYINMSYAEMLSMSASALDATVTELNTAISNAVTYCGSQATYDALYADYATGIANFRDSVTSAKDFANYMPTVDAWNALVAANPNYGVFQYDNFGEKGSATQVKLLEDFATFKGYRDHLLTGGSIYQYLLDNHYIDETYYTNFFDNVVAYDLQDSKNAADALYAQYSAVNPGMDENKYSYDESLVAYNAFAGFINNIANYSEQVKNAVYTSGWQYLIDMREFFKCEINEAVMYFAENAYKSFETVLTANIIREIETAKNHEANLTALYNEVVANAGTDKANQLLSALRAAAAAMIEGMYQTLADRFTAQVNEADRVYAELKRPTTLNMVTYLQLSNPILALEDGWDKNYHPENYDDNADNNYNRGDNGIIGIQDVLDAAGKGSLISNATRTTWNNFINAIYETWLKYGVTYGFADYVQSQIQYADRTVMENDELKTTNDPVTEAEMLKLIEALDKIITSDTVGGLLGGLLGAEEGEAFNLGTMLSDLIKGALFTDEFINTVVQMLYPLVVKEFSKVWATLPTSIEYEGMDVTVRYKKSLNNILDEGKFQIFPDLLAKKLEELGYSTKYKDNIAMLKAAGGETDAWESPKLVDYETGKLMLSWGVAEQKEKLDAGEISQAQFDAFFYQAFEDATAGLLPLLTTLITNKPWTPDKCTYIATGQVTVLFAPVTLNVDLQLGSTANSGYANLLVPVYELLGVPYTAVSTIESSTHNADIAYVLEQILTPIFTFLGKLGDAPVDTILEILPDLVYALTFRMAKPLLNMLNTTITYSASANIVGEVLADGALIEVGNMLITDADDAVLPNSAFTNGINSLLSFFGLNIPAIDQNTLATLGELTTMSTTRKAWIYDNSKNGSGKAYTIKADKADVGYFLLNYILNIVKNPDSFAQLLGIFMTQKDENGEVIKDADGKSIPDTAAIAKLQETLYNDEGLNFDELNVGNAIAAIVELANQPEYIVDAYNWYAGEYNSATGSAALDVYLNPANDWTEEKAEYLYDNLENILTAILTMAKLDLDKTTEEVDGSIEGALEEAIGGLFSNKTVTALAKLLGGLDLNALLAGGEAEEDANAPETVADGEEAEEEAPLIDINKLIKDELGIDLSVYAQYKDLAEDEEIDFGVTDADSFVAALTDLLAPLKPLLDFILAGKDLTLIDSAITLHGYKGYDNAIIPLLEALGATPAAYTDGADTLALTLNGLVGVINKLTTNDPAVEKDGAIYTIIDILPGVLYYISSNALSQGVDKLLTPVYAILDTIRPIYDIDLIGLITGANKEETPEEAEEGEEAAKPAFDLSKLDIENLTWSFIFDLLKDLLGIDLSDLKQLIYDVCDDIETTYTSASALNSTWKKGAYNENFDQADLITVILSFILDWASDSENAAKLDTLLKTNGLIASIGKVFEDVEITYGTPNWMYWFESEDAFNAYIESGAGLPNTLASLEYPDGNDWDLETAQYFAENIDVLVDKIIAMIEINGKKYESVSDLLNDLVNGNLGKFFTAETIDTLIGYISGVLANVDDVLLNVGYELLGVNLVALKNYKCEAEIDDLASFVAELARILDSYAKPLIDLLFFGDDIRLAKKSDKTDTIVINGGKGYEKGLAIILEALGCKNLPEVKAANATNVLKSLTDRVDEILADPVNEILDLLPNLVYALNADAVGVAVNNLLGPVNALLDKINGLGLLEKEININELLTVEINGEEVEILKNLKLSNVVEIVEGATGLPLDAAEAILVNFCTGKITKGTYIYKMAAAREDVITILLYVALELVSDEDFAKALDEMLGTDFIAKIKEIFAPSSIEYDTPDWNYAAADNGTVDAMKYSITYPNNWNEDTAEYVTDVLLSDDFDKLIAGLIEDGKYATISELLKDKVNIFTTKTLEDLLDLIEGFLGGIDEELLKLGFILDVKLDKLVKYEVKKDIDTVQEFADELAYILGEFAPGVVEWLLLGRDFKLLVKDADGIGEGLDGEAYITISGAEGYKKGLAILLEALGCENLPSPVITEENTTAKIIKGVLTSLAARIDEILSDPIVEVIDLLPNLFYFLNTNGVAAVIKNTTAALTALSAKINVFVDVNLDVASMVNLKELLKLPKEAKLSMTNLSMAAVLEAVGMLVGLDLTKAENVLVGFALGKFEGYTSVSGDSYAKKMVYADEFDKHDLVTVVANLALLVLADEANAEFVKGLVGKDVYDVILNVLQIKEAELKKMSWQHTDKVGQSFNAMTSSENYKGYGYGPRYTEEMADYIAENIGEFVDNIIYLLGIEIEGESVDSLEEILKNLVNGNLYNSANIVAIRDALAGLLDKIAGLEVNGIVVGGYIVDVLKTSLGVDVAAVAKVEVPEFTEDKVQFITYLGKVVDPLGPILNWILTDKDIAFFAKEGEDGKPTDFIKLPGNAGYKNGIVLLLEALGCENIVAPADLEGASGSAIVTAIAEPLLNRLDEIINNPAEELLAVLPNLIYFINSNGVDVVVKNTLNAVYTILNAIEPIAKIDLYELIGLDLETLTFEKLIDMLLKDLEIAGFKFTEIPMDTFVELTVGKLETYDSLSAEDPAYRMVYDENSASEGDMVTVLLRLVITFILTENNREVLINLLKSELGMSADAEKYVAALFKALADCTIGNQLGMDSALATIYYVYYGLDKGVGEAADGKKDLDKAWKAKLKELGYSDNKDEQSVGNLITDILDIVFNDQGNVPDDGGNDVLDKDGLASNGFLSFFQRIKIFFEEIAAFFRELFSFGK